jgi:signal transduction histidine kinase
MRGLLLVLVAVLIVPVLVVQAFIYGSRFEARRAEEYRANLELARAVARAFDQHVRDVLHQALAVGLALRARGPAAIDDASRLLAASAEEYPSITSYAWIDPRGRVLAASDRATTGTDVGDQPFFRDIAAGRPWTVGDLVQGEPGAAPTFVIARGMREGRGRLEGVIAARVDPSRLGTALAIPRAARGAVAIIDRNGRGVYRYPEADLTWEQRDWLASQPILAPALTGREVTGTFVSVLDGRVRMTGLTPISSIGWVASANRPEAEVLGPVRRGMLQHFGILVVVAAASIAAALGLGRSLTRSLARLSEHALAVGRGEFTHPVRVDYPAELRAAGAAFERMATEIAGRDDQRKRLLATIAHELRNPLAPLRASAAVLERAAPGGEQARRALDVMTRQIEQIARLVDDLLDVQRLSSGKMQLERQRVDVNGVVRGVADDHRDVFATNGITLDVLEAPGPLYVDADPTRLAQVLRNLLQNSAKFTPRDGRTTIAVTAGSGGEAVVTVSDTGRGIAPEGMGRLFEPFAQMDETSDRIQGGLGLGLALVKGVVEMHGGTVTVTSGGPGKGASFVVTLPPAGPTLSGRPRRRRSATRAASSATGPS